MSSSSPDIMTLLYRFLSASEVARVRLSIHAGARGYLSGKYTLEQLEMSAQRICSLIQGAHIVETKSFEEQTGLSFIDACKAALVKEIQEEAMRSVSPYRTVALTEEEQKEEEKRMKLF